MFSSPETQLRRLCLRDAIPEDQATKKIDAQWSIERKEKLASFVVNNDGDLEVYIFNNLFLNFIALQNTKDQVLDLMRILKRSNHHWFFRGGVLLVCF